MHEFSQFFLQRDTKYSSDAAEWFGFITLKTVLKNIVNALHKHPAT